MSKLNINKEIILIPIMSENMLIINLLGTFLFIQKIILEIYCGNQFFSSYNGLIWQKSLYLPTMTKICQFCTIINFSKYSIDLPPCYLLRKMDNPFACTKDSKRLPLLIAIVIQTKCNLPKNIYRFISIA